jgi:hypothetical protein
VLGAPELKGNYFSSFTPVGIPGMAETPLHMNQVCYGLDLRHYDVEKLRKTKKVNLQWMMELYKAFPNRKKFFDYSQSKEMGNIDKLAGTTQFEEQIIAGASEEEIREKLGTWFK